MQPKASYPHKALTQSCRLDLLNPEVLLAWRNVLAGLEGFGQQDGIAALLSGASDAAPKSIETGPLLEQARWRVPMLVSSTRQVDISGALDVALPLIGAGPGLTPSWDDFLMGYLCGLRTSPSLDEQRVRFLEEFGDAMMAASVRSTAASQTWINRTVRGKGPPWIYVVLEAISYGSVALAALLAERALHTGHTSGTDSLFGALLGSALWKASPYEIELIDRLSGSAPHSVQSG